MDMRNLKIGKKVSICFVVLLMFTTFANGKALYNLKQSGQLSEDLFKGPYQSTTQSMGIRRDLVAVGRYLGNAIMEKNITEYKPMTMNEFDSIYKRIDQIHSSFDGDKKVIEELKVSIDKLKQECEKVFGFIEQGKYDYAIHHTLTHIMSV
jgi:methyl-accepting chemotaxis protein